MYVERELHLLAYYMTLLAGRNFCIRFLASSLAPLANGYVLTHVGLEVINLASSEIFNGTFIYLYTMKGTRYFIAAGKTFNNGAPRLAVTFTFR